MFTTELMITPEMMETEYLVVAVQVRARIAEYHADHGGGGTLLLPLQSAATLFRYADRSGINPREWDGPLAGVTQMFGLRVRVQVEPVGDRLTPPRVV